MGSNRFTRVKDITNYTGVSASPARRSVYAVGSLPVLRSGCA
jgi:hypothetical protein